MFTYVGGVYGICVFFSGAGVVTPWEGIVVSGECLATTELTDEQVELELDVSKPLARRDVIISAFNLCFSYTCV